MTTDEFYILKSRAEGGQPEAQVFLGIVYLSQKDFGNAAKWFMKAAEQGNVQAQTKLGALFLTGQGVPKDEEKAAIWFGKAAEKGDARAQFHMGLLSQDEIKAVEWLRKAANQGDTDAKNLLDEINAEERAKKERE